VIDRCALDRERWGLGAPGDLSALKLPGREAIDMDVVPLATVGAVRKLQDIPDLLSGHASATNRARGADAGTVCCSVRTSRRELPQTDRVTDFSSEDGFIEHLQSPRFAVYRLNARCHEDRRLFASPWVLDGRLLQSIASRTGAPDR